jgi:hypothetical protein
LVGCCSRYSLICCNSLWLLTMVAGLPSALASALARSSLTLVSACYVSTLAFHLIWYTSSMLKPTCFLICAGLTFKDDRYSTCSSFSLSFWSLFLTGACFDSSACFSCFGADESYCWHSFIAIAYLLSSGNLAKNDGCYSKAVTCCCRAATLFGCNDALLQAGC